MFTPSRRIWTISILFSSKIWFTLFSVFVSNIINWNLPEFGFDNITLKPFENIIYTKTDLMQYIAYHSSA